MALASCCRWVHSVSYSCFLQSFNKLEIFAASKKINIVSKLQVAKWLYSYYCRGVKLFCIFFSRNTLIITVDNGHPCHMPTVVWRKSLTPTLSNTANGSYIVQRPNDFNQLVVDVVLKPCHRPSCQTRLITFLQSMKLWKWYSSATCNLFVPFPRSVLPGLPAYCESRVTRPCFCD